MHLNALLQIEVFLLFSRFFSFASMALFSGMADGDLFG
jgi:hypothetical protein